MVAQKAKQSATDTSPSDTSTCPGQVFRSCGALKALVAIISSSSSAECHLAQSRRTPHVGWGGVWGFGGLLKPAGWVMWSLVSLNF